MIYILSSVRYSVTAFVATIGTRCGKYTSCGPPITVEMFMLDLQRFFKKRRRNKKTLKT